MARSGSNADGCVRASRRQTATAGTKTVYTYDPKGNLTNIDNPAPLGDITITPDALSRLETLVDGKGQTTGYTYDPLDRQDVVTYHDGSTVDRNWDTDGNRAMIMALARKTPAVAE